MDINLAQTFLEILTAGNFRNAASRLHVTQAAVSLRVKKLEEELGHEVFVRSKSGVTLTAAGKQFERFARSMMKVWEEARYHVAVPDGFNDTLIVGGEYSLWPNFGFRWLRLLERQLPTVSLRADVGKPDRLLRLMLDGVLDIAIMYSPQLRPGLEVEVLIEDNLMLVSTDPEYTTELDDDYVFIDYGDEFVHAHGLHFPKFQSSQVTLSLGTLSARYVVEHKRAAYLPARFVQDLVDEEELYVVKGAPVFPFPAYVVWNPEKEHELMEKALRLLRRVAERIDEDQNELFEEEGIEQSASHELGMRITGTENGDR